MNTPANWRVAAKITNEEQAELLRQAFDCGVVPIRSIVPSPVNLPGHPDAPAYFLDLDAISDGQRARLIAALAGKFGQPESDVADHLEEHGVPILADDVIVGTKDRGVIIALLDSPVESWAWPNR